MKQLRLEDPKVFVSYRVQMHPQPEALLRNPCPSFDSFQPTLSLLFNTFPSFLKIENSGAR